MNTLTHVDADGRPTMVDVGGKVASARVAVAEARVRLPHHVAQSLAQAGFWHEPHDADGSTLV